MSSSSESHLILYGEPVPADLGAIAESVLPPGFDLPVVSSRSRDELLDQIAGADFLLVSTARVDQTVPRAGPRLRLVQHQGVGYDNIDVAAC